ncbi:MAG: response regulator [Myxococcales bacterium]|nr:response regulator [Polyangiaceae bacterium]MDW8248687.1 response regulator [Myxococcales bacterium]
MSALPSLGRLRILVVAGDPAVLELCRTVFNNSGDNLVLLGSLASGVQEVQEAPPDLAFIDVALEQRAALALVHHIKAISQEAEVYAVTTMAALDAASQAVSLGATGVIMSPPSGDELLSAANGVKARRAAVQLRTQLRVENDGFRRALGYIARMANLADQLEGDNVGLAVAELFREASGMPQVALYLPTLEGANELRLSVSVGSLGGAPAFCDEMGLMRYAKEASLEVIPLLAGRLSMGHVLVGGAPWQEGPMRQAVHVLAAQATTLLMLAAERERVGRGTIKDGATSAYTFAYFVDIAGREIDKAKRHGRRFALATIMISSTPSPDGPPSRAVDVADTVLSIVRDSDVLARVDEHEFYLLLPETGGFGAQSCRRRILALESSGKLQGVSMGVATFPHDGTDLLRLLRMAKRRADASRFSVVSLFKLQCLSLQELTDALLWNADIAQGKLPPSPEVPRVLDLPLVDVLSLVTAAISQAVRGGLTSVIVAQQDEMGLATAVRAFPKKHQEEFQVHYVDVRHRDGCEDIQVLAIIAEHGSYALLGRVDHGIFQGLHAADPLLADLLVQRLGELLGVHFLD